jgi:CheY-like chemotaxis protein
VRALVVDAAAEARQHVCAAGRSVAGAECVWFEAADADEALRMVARSSIDLVVADSGSIRHGVREWLDRAAAVSGRPAPVLALLSNDEPRIQQFLDAGADCCLPKHPPQRVLEIELRRLVMQARRKERRS